MAARNDITAEQARQLLDYRAETGELIWKVRALEMFAHCKHPARACAVWNAKFGGAIAGCAREDDYWVVRIINRLYLGHRIIWLIVYGEWPQDELDHRFGVEKGDKIDNLRPATRSQNMQNCKMRSDNKSGHIGVSWSKAASKWGARIKIGNRYTHLGLFDDPKDASLAYLEAKKKHHPFQPVPREGA